MDRPLHPRRGPHSPRPGVPPLPAGGVRRETVCDSTRPGGLTGDVQLNATGRDLVAGEDLGSARVEAVASFAGERVLRSVRVDPSLTVEGLVGLRLSSGFRRELEKVVPDRESLAYQLLDDLPTALLVSGTVLAAAGLHPPPGLFDARSRADICAGWATGGTILVESDRLGHPPTVTGPPVPEPEGLAANSSRRRRRIDVWPAGGGGEVEAFFRDTLCDGDGFESVIHEYTVRAEVDGRMTRFSSCRAEVGVLPWTECPAALASAGRLAGVDPASVRDVVSGDFRGPSTCTHLNDTLRSLAALPHLARLSARAVLPGPPAGGAGLSARPVPPGRPAGGAIR